MIAPDKSHFHAGDKGVQTPVMLSFPALCYKVADSPGLPAASLQHKSRILYARSLFHPAK